MVATSITTHSFPVGDDDPFVFAQNIPSPITDETNSLPINDMSLVMFAVRRPRIKLLRKRREHWYAEESSDSPVKPT
jgi:hypothetical protein